MILELYTLADVPTINLAFVSMTMAAIGAVSSIVGIMGQEDAQAKQLEQYGKDKAANEMNAIIEQSKISAEAQQNKQETDAAKINIEQQALKAEASREVAAAASGVEGSSVDVGLNQISFDTGNTLGQIEQTYRNNKEILETKARNLQVQHRSASTNLRTQNQDLNNLAKVFASGLTGFISQRQAG